MKLARAAPERQSYQQETMGQNDGGIKRGDRADTGDEQARPTDGVGRGGSGVRGGATSPKDTGGSSGHPTGDASSEEEVRTPHK